MLRFDPAMAHRGAISALCFQVHREPRPPPDAEQPDHHEEPHRPRRPPRRAGAQAYVYSYSKLERICH